MTVATNNTKTYMPSELAMARTMRLVERTGVCQTFQASGVHIILTSIMNGIKGRRASTI